MNYTQNNKKNCIKFYFPRKMFSHTPEDIFICPRLKTSALERPVQMFLQAKFKINPREIIAPAIASSLRFSVQKCCTADTSYLLHAHYMSISLLGLY
jgi:hypothetical protein